MAMRRYRCSNPQCQAANQGVFLAEVSLEKATCPQCKKCGGDPKFGRLIARQPFIHFDPPSEVEGFGEGFRACDPATSITAQMHASGMPNPWHAGTGVISVVNCPACMETEAYKKALKQAEENEGDGLTKTAMQRLEKTRAV